MQEGRAPVLLTGASGRLGTLLRAVWTHDPPQGLCPLWQSRESRGPGWIRWDPVGPEPLGIDLAGGVVLHFAGPTPAGLGDLDATAALALAGLEAARAAGAAHVFLASSAAIYGRPQSAAPLIETTPPAPATRYGAAKAEMERAARRWRDAAGAGAGAGSGIPGLTILRLGNLAGADALLSAARDAGPEAPLALDRFADGTTPRRSYIGPASLATVLAALARHALSGAGAGAALPELLNLAAPGPGVEMGALLAALARAGHPVAMRHVAAGPGALPSIVLDTARLQALVPLPPETGTAGGLVAEWLDTGAAA